MESNTSALSKRILAAIVFTDCVGFSARMAAEEEQTLILIKQDLTLIKDPPHGSLG